MHSNIVKIILLISLATTFLLSACDIKLGKKDKDKTQRPLVSINTNPYPSTYKPFARANTLITNATILDGIDKQYDNYSLLIKDGKIAAIGKDLTADTATTVIDAKGKWLTPGIIDVHSHMGVYPSLATHSHC